MRLLATFRTLSDKTLTAHPTPKVSGFSIRSEFCLTLLSTDAASGLEYVRGSHRWPQRFKAIGVGEGGNPIEMWPRSELADVPDIDAHRDQYEVISWDFAPGDVLFFHPCTLHGSGTNTSPTQRRRAFATRWVGDDVIFTGERTLPLPGNHGLKPGDRLSGPVFPVVLEVR